MRKAFLTGLIILLPIAVTLFIIFFIIDLLTAPFMGFVHEVLKFLGQNVAYLSKHQGLLLFISRLIVLLFLVVVILILGYLGNKIFSNFLLNTFHKLVMKIPFVKKIYKIVRDIVKTFFSDKKNAFEATVLVQFPKDGTYALGLQSGDIPKEAHSKITEALDKENYKSVFVPTSPHPVSGFLLMIKESDAKKLDVTTEECFKFLISAGLFKPKEDQQSKTEETNEKP